MSWLPLLPHQNGNFYIKPTSTYITKIKSNPTYYITGLMEVIQHNKCSSFHSLQYVRVFRRYLAIDNLVNCHWCIHITAITGLAARSCGWRRHTSCDVFAKEKFFLKKGISFLSTLHVFINL